MKKFVLRLTGRRKCYFLHFAFTIFPNFKWLLLKILYRISRVLITTSLLMIHWKCTVVHYANLNSSSINKPFLNYGLLNMLFCFFRFLIYVYFNEAFVKNFVKNYRILQNVRISMLVTLKWRHIEYNAKFEKRACLI